MSAVVTYKALDYDLKTYGFWPPDLILVLLLFVFVHVFFNSLTLDILGVGPVLYLAYRARRRPPVFLRSLFFFASTAARFPIGLRREPIIK
jgi:hypothetical protein